jgi:ferredoxin-type protein NapH
VARQPARRQRIRKALIIFSFLLFPITINYFSPYVIVDGASQGIVNGSFISFTLMFLSALFLGRLWCGWACPGGGLQEIAFAVNDKPARGGKFNWIKWAIWIPWIGIIAMLAIRAGGYRTVNFFHLTEGGISVDRPEGYIIYYTVVGLLVVLSLTAGRRAGCHYICWMAPFMILGRKVRNLFRWPSLRLKAETENCTNCKRCTANCPMSLDVNGMVQRGRMEDSECILCGSCVDVCPKEVIRYSFSAGK